MNRFVTLTLSVALAMGIASPAFAQDNRGPGRRGMLEKIPLIGSQIERRKEVRDEREDSDKDQEDMREDMRERMGFASSTASSTMREKRGEMMKASSTERRIIKQQANAKRQIENTARVISATIGRLNEIINRVESRIAKVKAAGGNTAQAETFVASAKADLLQASTSVETLKALAPTSDSAQENKEAIKAAAKEAKDHIRDAHEALMNAVRSLGRDNSEERNASTTSER